MSQYNIAIVVGSLRKESFNKTLAIALTKLAPSAFHFTHIDIGDLPLYNQDDDDNMAPSVKRLKAEIAAADGVIFLTPEYNRSIPGVLKNAIDHDRMARALGLESLLAFWVSLSARSARQPRNNIYAIYLHTWTCRR